MMRMNYDSFKFVLLKIEKYITPLVLAKGGLKPISPAERLTLTLRFLATGETYRSVSFQFEFQFHCSMLHAARMNMFEANRIRHCSIRLCSM